MLPFQPRYAPLLVFCHFSQGMLRSSCSAISAKVCSTPRVDKMNLTIRDHVDCSRSQYVSCAGFAAKKAFMEICNQWESL